jgi:hypothetical protein
LHTCQGHLAAATSFLYPLYIWALGTEIPSALEFMPSTKLPRPHKSAVSTFYYVVFGVIEPLLTLASLLEAVLDPEKVRMYVGQR